MVDETIHPDVRPSGTGCVECDAEGLWWVHLRRCAECGHIGCCDDSLERHARRHWQATGHAVIRSFEPGEDWFWDFARDDYVVGPRLAPPESRPEAQGSPAPADRLPPDWREQLRARRAAGA